MGYLLCPTIVSLQRCIKVNQSNVPLIKLHEISFKYDIMVKGHNINTKYEYYHSCLRTLLVTVNNYYKQKY